MKTLYKDKLLNLAATMAQSLGFNNAKKGKLQSTNVQDAIDELAMRDEMISDAWVSSATYTAGEYVFYKNTLYKCLATTTPGIVPSEGIYWTITRVSDELENITDDIDSLNSTMVKNTFGEVVDIKSYVAASPFVAPSDGYITIHANSGTTNACTCMISGSSGSTTIAIDTFGLSSDSRNNSIFIKKGMKAYNVWSQGTIRMQFVPLV